MSDKLSSLEWLTLRECAIEAGVDLEVVRQWCLAHEQGKPSGLPSTNFSAGSHKKNRRVHQDDWTAFKRQRRSGAGHAARRETRELRKTEKVIDYV